jgi:hypothetical protein
LCHFHIFFSLILCHFYQICAIFHYFQRISWISSVQNSKKWIWPWDLISELSSCMMTMPLRKKRLQVSFQYDVAKLQMDLDSLLVNVEAVIHQMQNFPAIG